MNIDLDFDIYNLAKIFQQKEPVYIGQQMLVPEKLLYTKKEFLCIVTQDRFTILKDLAAAQQQGAESIKKLELNEAFILASKKGNVDDVKFLLATELVSDDLIKQGFLNAFTARDDQAGSDIGLYFYNLYKVSVIDQNLVVQAVKEMASKKLYSPNMCDLCRMLLEMEDFYSAGDNKKVAEFCFMAVKDKYVNGVFGVHVFSGANCLKTVFLMNLSLAQKIEIYRYIKIIIEAMLRVLHSRAIGVAPLGDLSIDVLSVNLSKKYISKGDHSSLKNLVLNERRATLSQELLYCIFAQAKNCPENSDSILKYLRQFIKKNILIYDIQNAAEHGKFEKLVKLLKIAHMNNILDFELISILNVYLIESRYQDAPEAIIYILMIINSVCENEASKSNLAISLERVKSYNHSRYNEVASWFEKEIMRREFTVIDFRIYNAVIE